MGMERGSLTMKMRKRILPMVLAVTMAGSLASFHVQAKDEDDTISLPVQLYDFDADGLFYEYALYNGMDTFGLGESNNEGVTQGLVNNTLGQNGLPVYTQKAVESAAKTIRDNLVKGKQDVSKPDIKDADKLYTSYDIFKKFMNKDEGTDPSYSSILFANSNNVDKKFYELGWSLNSNDIIYGSNGTLHSGVGTVWQQETDGVINNGAVDTLTKTIEVEAGKEYAYSRYCDNADLEFQILDANGNILVNNGNKLTFAPETSTIQFVIYRRGTTSTRGKFALAKVFPNGEAPDNYPNLLGDTTKSTNFITEGWVSKNYNSTNATIGNDRIVDGTTYWKQDGDGVRCVTDSSIVFNTGISSNQFVQMKYWLDANENGDSGLSIDVLDGNGTVLTTQPIDNTGGWSDCKLDIPQGNGNITIRINGQSNSARIAALSITPMGSAFPLGNYEETVQKYQNNQLKSVDDCTSCMDYAYLRLTNFFNTSFYKNRLSNKYTEMVLKSHEKEDGTIEYTFDSSKEVTYNDGGTFYNKDGGAEASGFFPLDYIGGEKLSDQNGDNAVLHNYHFGMNVDGDFIYREGANQFFDFSGDDDVYVFINGKLAVDLGGAHKEVSSSLDIEQYAKENGIKNGEKCKFQMFYLERHTTASNCKIQTNLNIGNHAEYQFVSKTEGMELPDEIKNMTPIDDETYYDGQTVTNKEYNKKYKDVYDAANKGYWKFVGWDKDSQKDDKFDIQFVGSWEFVKDDFKVDYNFVSGTEGKDLPDEIKKLLPENKEHLIKDDQVNVDNNFNKEVKVSDGKWTFVSWDKESVTIVDKNESFTGTWVFTKDVTKPTNNNQNKPNTPSKPTKGDKKIQKSAKVKTGVSITISFYLAMLVSSLIGIVLFKKKRLYK